VYLQHVLHLLQSAMALSVQQITSDDLAEYNNSLRHGEGGAGGGVHVQQLCWGSHGCPLAMLLTSQASCACLPGCVVRVQATC
jgi:hypothetical protein